MKQTGLERFQAYSIPLNTRTQAFLKRNVDQFNIGIGRVVFKDINHGRLTDTGYEIILFGFDKLVFEGIRMDFSVRGKDYAIVFGNPFVVVTQKISVPCSVKVHYTYLWML